MIVSPTANASAKSRPKIRRTDLSIYLEEIVYPALFANLGNAFPEFGFVNSGDAWTATLWPPGFDQAEHKVPARLQVYADNCFGVKIHGHNLVPWLAYLNHCQQPKGQAFLDCARDLCGRAGVPFPNHEMSDQERDESRRWEERRSLADEVVAICHGFLMEDNPGSIAARDYLAKRGLTIEAIKDLKIGLYRSMLEVKKALKGSHEIAKEASLLWRKFSGFLTFPWRDASGAILTIYWRWPSDELPEKRNREGWDRDRNEQAEAWKKLSAKEKYEKPWVEECIPKTVALPGAGTKGSPLFFDRARKAGHSHLVAVEGVLDGAVLQTLGDDRVVAYVAANFARNQIETLKRYRVETVTLVPDPDGGGDKGADDSTAHLMAAGIKVYVAPRLPDGLDPDEFALSRGIEAWREHVARAVPGAVHRAGVMLGDITPQSPEIERRRILDRLVAYAALLTDALDRDSVVKSIADRTGYNLSLIKAKLKEHGKPPGSMDGKQAKTDRRSTTSHFTKNEETGVIEEDDDPHRLARIFRDGKFAHPDCPTLWYWRGDFHCWPGPGLSYRVYPDVREDLVAGIKEEFDRLNREMVEEITQRCLAKGEEVDPDSLPRVRKVGTKLVGDVMQDLKSESSLSTWADAPFWIETDDSPRPNPLEVLPCRNGLVALRDKSVISPTPLFFSPFVLDYDYVAAAGARPPLWHQFLEDILPGDTIAQRELQKWFGYFLTPDTRQQKILLVIGPKRSGKGTIARILEAMIGAHNCDSPTLGGMATQFGMQSLIGKSLALIKDARITGSSTDKTVVVERLLNISGEDVMTIDRKYRDAITAKILARIAIFSNEPPNFRDASGALAGRMIPFHLKQSFYGREDPDLTEKLIGEMPQILNWAIEGREMLREDRKFIIPECGKEIAENFVGMTSPIQLFVDECTDTKELNPDPRKPIEMDTIREIFGAYKGWCRTTRHESGSENIFGRNLQAAFPHIEVKRPREGDSSRARRYSGIRLNDVGIRFRQEEEAREAPPRPWGR